MSKLDKELSNQLKGLTETGKTVRQLTGQDKPETMRKEPQYKNIKNPSVTVAIRLRADLKDKLERHFIKKGYLSLSAALRAVIADYADKEGLLD